MRATKASIAGVFGRAAPTYERAGPPFFSEVARRLVASTDLPAGERDGALHWRPEVVYALATR